MHSKRNNNDIRTAALAMALLLAFPGQVYAEDVKDPVPFSEETSSTEVPRTEQPAETAPSQTEAPQTEQPKTEASQTEQPKTEPPQAEQPKTETSEAEQPKTETSETEQPKTEQPAETIPVTEAPADTETVTEGETQTESPAPEQSESETAAETQPTETEADTAAETETKKKKNEKKETEKELDRNAILNNYVKSAPFTNLQNRTRYDESVPIEGIPSFITQEMVIGALKIQDEYGYPASVTIAQIIAESGFGSYGPGGESGQGLTMLAYGYCNLFGIKGSGTAGSVSMKTWEMTNSGSTYTTTAAFRAYNTYTECIQDRAELISNYYSDLTAGVSDANTFAVKLGSRWATNLYYGQTLISLMETYDLYRLDDMTLLDIADLLGEFADPCPGSTLTSPFGYREFDQKFHKGIDLGTGSENIPTYAVLSGTVTYAGYDDTAGNMIIIDHGNGLVTKYMHHSAVYVSVGDKVERGQQIGLSGTTGRSTGNHLHFQVEKNGTAVDPMTYLTASSEDVTETETEQIKEQITETVAAEETEDIQEAGKVSAAGTENVSDARYTETRLTETEFSEPEDTTTEDTMTEDTITEDTVAEDTGSFTLMTVNDRVNVRKEPSLDGAAVALFKPGMKLLVISEDGEWTKVRFEDEDGLTEGFIKTEFLVDAGQVFQAKEKVNVRKETSTDSEKIGSLEAGKKVILLEDTENGWLKIRYSEDKTLIDGYVKAEFLEKTDREDGVSILIGRS